MGVHNFTASDFRSRQAHLFDLADKGEQVVINRGRNRAYTLVPVNNDDMTITPELQARIDRARQSVREGRCKVFSNHEEMDNYFKAL